MSLWWIRFERKEDAACPGSDIEPVIVEADFLVTAYRWAEKQLTSLQKDGIKSYHIQAFIPVKVEPEVDDLLEGWIDMGGEG